MNRRTFFAACAGAVLLPSVPSAPKLMAAWKIVANVGGIKIMPTIALYRWPNNLPGKVYRVFRYRLADCTTPLKYP